MIFLFRQSFVRCWVRPYAPIECSNRTRLWRKWNIIDRDMARDIEIYSLIHDIGHGPYSHVVEAVTAINHDERGLELLNGLAKVIKQCGGNLENIKRLPPHCLNGTR